MNKYSLVTTQKFYSAKEKLNSYALKCFKLY